MKKLILIFFTFVLLVGCPNRDPSQPPSPPPPENQPVIDTPSGCPDFIIGVSSLGDACLK